MHQNAVIGLRHAVRIVTPRNTGLKSRAVSAAPCRGLVSCNPFPPFATPTRQNRACPGPRLKRRAITSRPLRGLAFLIRFPAVETAGYYQTCPGGHSNACEIV